MITSQHKQACAPNTPLCTHLQIENPFQGLCDDRGQQLRAVQRRASTLTSVLVFQDVGEGWWEARNSRGQIGLVPSAYVEVRTRTAVMQHRDENTTQTLYRVFTLVGMEPFGNKRFLSQQ